jgi:toxin ParE1/3/4
VPRLVFAPRAIDDAHAILTTLAEKASRSVAEAYFDRFRSTFDRLLMFPLSGGPRPKLGANVRIAVVRPYIVIYQTIADDVEIMRLLHGRRKITRQTMTARTDRT